MIISICGLSGSGKTTLARGIGKYMKYPVVSASDIFRSVAKERGISLSEMSKIADKDIDRAIDFRTKYLCENRDDFIIEGRLVCYFCERSIRIYVYASLDLRAKRYSIRENISFDKAKREIQERDKYDLARYKKLYGIEDYDTFMRKRCDIIIDTSKYNIQEMIDYAISQIEKFSSMREHTRDKE